MRIGIDAHDIGAQSGGNETFVRQLLRALNTVSPQTDVIALVNADQHGIPGVGEGYRTHPIPTRSSWLRVPIGLPFLIKKLGLDLIHVQYSAPPHCPCPYIIALHDMVWKRFPETLPTITRWRLDLLAPRTVRNARRVFCLTDAMRHEAGEIYKVPEEKIDVVSPAVDPIYQPVTDPAKLDAVRKKYKLPSDFILYVGQLQPRKNLVRLAKAFDRLKDQGLSHRLVFTGRATHYGPIAEQIDALNLGDRLLFTGYVDTQDLPAMFSAADAFAYVSLYEGFGIPVVEALACGTPTLTSTDPSLSEISGGAALTVDPHDIDAIEHGLVQILTDSDLRDRFKHQGPLRAQTYNLQHMGQAALAGYQKALA